MSMFYGRRLSTLLAISVWLSASFGLAARAAEGDHTLTTRWTAQVSAAHPLPEYPRPQLQRKSWLNLNGPWQFSVTDQDAAQPTTFDGAILVPFCIESKLSGVQKPLLPTERLWYRRTFEVPAAWRGQHCLLHFGAVDWDTKVLVNGREVGVHRGGYDAFDIDITDALKPAGSQELVVSVWDPTDTGAQPIGKQRLKPGGIFYTPCSGIWQTVWLEPVPSVHIQDLRLVPDIDAGKLRVRVLTDSGETASARVSIQAIASGKVVASAEGGAGAEAELAIPSAHLWSPADPYLYSLKVTLTAGSASDSVSSYFAMRKISLGKDSQGRTRIFLNNKFLFQVGTLDQGFWPDGIYTAPTDSALAYDIQITKRLGFNMIRKHAKVEPDRWYYWTDRLGMLVWQDMPQSFKDRMTADQNTQWDTEWKREIATHYNHPSIVVWTTFNEGWGQHDTPRVVEDTRRLDPTRLVNNASGWTDNPGVGDMHDMHKYPAPGSPEPEADRAAVLGEFGGLGMRVEGHMWEQKSWGYQGLFRSGWQLTQRYQEYLKSVYKLIEEPGLSAIVYTQITDVETESNGLLTYDRAVVKPDLAIIAAANQGKWLPLPPAPRLPALPRAVLPTSEAEGARWKWTTDAPASGWFEPGFSDASWQSGEAPFGHALAGTRTDWSSGDIWLRREVTLPAGLPAHLAFSVFHDEDVEIYVNGVLAADAKGFVSEYATLPMTRSGRAALKPGANVIAIHCHQTIGGQFIDVGIIEAR